MAVLPAGSALAPVLAATGLLAAAGLLALALSGSGAGSPPVPRTLLLTGFGPFGRTAENPSWEAARRLDGVRIGSTTIRAARLEVEWEGAERQLREAVRRTAPDAVLCLGVSPGDRLRLEVVARNRDRAPEPDVGGVVRAEDVPIRPGGPALLPTRLPVAALLRALHEAGFPEATTSDDAGGYLCNHVFWRLLDEFPEGRPVGFVHVPEMGGAWTVERLVEAVRVMAATLDAGGGGRGGDDGR